MASDRTCTSNSNKGDGLVSSCGLQSVATTRGDEGHLLRVWQRGAVDREAVQVSGGLVRSPSSSADQLGLPDMSRPLWPSPPHHAGPVKWGASCRSSSRGEKGCKPLCKVSGGLSIERLTRPTADTPGRRANSGRRGTGVYPTCTPLRGPNSRPAPVGTRFLPSFSQTPVCSRCEGFGRRI